MIKPAATPLSFFLGDIELFSQASHDRNPLHICGEYARKSPFGDRVVFGVLAGLASLAHLRSRSGYALSRVRMQFKEAIFTDTKYWVKTEETDLVHANIRVMDGKRVLLIVNVEFEANSPENESDSKPEYLEERPALPSQALEPEVLTKMDLFPGYAVEGDYSTVDSAMVQLIDKFGLSGKGMGLVQAAVLMCCSYLVGMKIPGQQALLLELSIDFNNLHRVNINCPNLHYKASVIEFDQRFDLAKICLQITLADQTIACGEISTYLRPDPVSLDKTYLSKHLVPASKLRGKVALVIGGSRGLGAAISYALGVHGCTTYVNYSASDKEAKSLEAAMPDFIHLLKADASDVRQCLEIRKHLLHAHGKIDILICNACPVPRPLFLNDDDDHRIIEYVSRALALTSVPMGVFLPAMSSTSGACVVISSEFVTKPRAELPHYVSAKCAVEGLSRAVAAEYKQISFLMVRPPRLLTDWTITPLGKLTAIGPEQVAVRICEALESTTCPGQSMIIDSF